VEPATLVFAALVFVAAGFVKGVIGLGLPTVAVGFLSLLLPPAGAASLMLVPSLITNIWQIVAGPNLWSLTRRLALLLVGIAVGTWAGSGVLTGARAGQAAVALGVVLVIYAVVGLSKVRLAVPQAVEPWLSAPVGLVTGIVSAATGIFVMPSVPYLQALGFEKDDLVQALGITFLAATVALAAGLASTGAFRLDVAGASLAMLVPALLGMWLGQIVRARISAERFRFWFLVGLIGLGLHLALKPLF
jgi:uncharacterized protein